MNELLTKLGVPLELQAFYGWLDTDFSFGDDQEVFDLDHHFVPTTHNLWFSGSTAASTILIGHSAMELIAYMTLQAAYFTDLHAVALIAVGNLPLRSQLQYILKYFPRRRFELIFGNDLLAALMDIKVSMVLKNKHVQLFYDRDQVVIRIDKRSSVLMPSAISLSIFEKTIGVRSGIRTRKPKQHTSFLDQLRSVANI